MAHQSIYINMKLSQTQIALASCTENQPMIEEHGIDHDAEDDNELNSEDDVPGPDHEENDE